MQYALTFLATFIGLMGFFFGLRALLAYRQVAKDAREDYAYKLHEDLFEQDIPEEAYIQAYRRYHAPRGTAYIAGAMAAILALTYPAFVMIQFILDQLWIFTGRSSVFHPGYLVWQFMVFFLVIALWGAVIFMTAREYHRRAPLSFKNVLDQELGA